MCATFNLPTISVQHSVAFLTSLGFANEINGAVKAEKDDPDAYTPCLTWRNSICIILHSHKHWSTMFQQPWGPTYKPIHNAHTSVSHALVLNAENRTEVDTLCLGAARIGGRLDPVPLIDDSRMYNRCVEDPDGRVWSLCAVKGAPVSETSVGPQKSRSKEVLAGLKLFTASMNLATAAAGS